MKGSGMSFFLQMITPKCLTCTSHRYLKGVGTWATETAPILLNLNKIETELKLNNGDLFLLKRR